MNNYRCFFCVHADPQIECVSSGYFQNRFDCTTFIACLHDPGLQIPVVHIMDCPRGLFWDDGYKICLEYSNTCKDGDSYYKQIYNHRYLILPRSPPSAPSPLLPPRRRLIEDDLARHKSPELRHDDVTLNNGRVKLQSAGHQVTDDERRNHFKSGGGGGRGQWEHFEEDNPREILPLEVVQVVRANVSVLGHAGAAAVGNGGEFRNDLGLANDHIRSYSGSDGRQIAVNQKAAGIGRNLSEEVHVLYS